MKEKQYIIAVDGGAATGKSTISKQVATMLDILYIDTGAMYRAVTLYFIQNNIAVTEEEIKKHLPNIKIHLTYQDGITKVYLNEVEVSSDIRTEEVSELTPSISSYPMVRDAMVLLQRKMAQTSSVILDGRDIGTFVFPDATLKIYLVASDIVRAKRRQLDMLKKGEHYSLEDMVLRIQERDRQDKSKKYAPLKQASDAIVIDTSEDDIIKNAQKIIEELKKRVDV